MSVSGHARGCEGRGAAAAAAAAAAGQGTHPLTHRRDLFITDAILTLDYMSFL